MVVVDDGKLHAALLPVFKKFDADGSGFISTDELKRMTTELKMEMSKDTVRKMMVEADPDQSGEIDFDEFVAVIKKQVEGGQGGSLASLVEQASGFFGLFGGLVSLFAPPPIPKIARTYKEPTAPPPPATPARDGDSSSLGVVLATSAAPPSGFGGGAPSCPAASLYDQYMSPSDARHKLGHGETRTARLRATGVKLSVYLNTEVDRGRATVISLPEDCDTLGEVLPKIQQQMQLDRRMCYAAELYLPDGTRIASYKQLIDAAALDTAIIVGCGEPFDPSTIPYVKPRAVELVRT